MQKVLVIVAHPDIENSTINRSWIESLTGHVSIHQLYQAYPDEKIDILHEQRLVEEHDRIIFQFPFYWYSAPSLLKKWFDEVLTEGWAYGAGGDAWAKKEIGVAISCGGSQEDFIEGGAQVHPLSTYLSCFEGIASFARTTYIGFHALYDSYNPATLSKLLQNGQEYLQFATQPLR